ncbi:hypothetical protein PUN28_001882 [Cardiocondyla obscurior]|uniref:Uncharacterized protein n=1 Tax=Cardiocondyla obscurior TaxID=286306 RepID=A0AAW2GRM2_9HYME
MDLFERNSEYCYGKKNGRKGKKKKEKKLFSKKKRTRTNTPLVVGISLSQLYKIQTIDLNDKHYIY